MKFIDFARSYQKTLKVAYFTASSTATAQATVAPTIGLLPNPKIIFVFMYLCLIVSSETLAITAFQSSLFEFCIFLCFAVFCCILANIFHFDEYLTNLSSCFPKSKCSYCIPCKEQKINNFQPRMMAKC